MPHRLLIVTLIATTGLGRAAEPAAFEVEVKSDIPYHTGGDADKTRHTLDVYAPKGQKDAPVLFYIHGGAWKIGSKEYLSASARRFAEAGICVVCPNYRLSPKVQHPAHVQDVAKAFAWAAENVSKYGGSAEKMVVGGHSAGGHLAALLATDDTYLKAEKKSLADVRGIVGISGVYVINGHPTFVEVFGKDAAGHKAASPATHAGPNTPPALLVYADKDYPQLDKSAATFADALKKARRTVTLTEFRERDHLSIVSKMHSADDPVFQAIKEFVRTQTAK